MSSLCRVCLVGNVKMYPIESKNIIQTYESVTNTKLSTVQGPQTVCYLCHCLLHKYGKFSEQARNSEYILKDLYNKGIEATSENIAKTNHVIQINFSTTCTETMDLKDIQSTNLSDNGDASAKDNTVTMQFETVIFNEETHIKEEVDDITEEADEAMDQSQTYVEVPIIEGIESKGDGLVCDTCGKMFMNKNELVTHIQNDHKSEKTNCIHCNKEFSSKSLLEKHMMVHEESKKKDIDMDLADFIVADDDNLTEKSKQKYVKCYQEFMKWHSKKGFNSFAENVFLTYFNLLAVTYKPPTLWSVFSMLNSMVKLKQNVNMKQYYELTSFLKRQSEGYKTQKSKVFTAEELQTFLNEAPDEIYLAIKVVMIMAIGGACTGPELIRMKEDDVEKQGELIVVRLRGTKKKNNRTFIVQKEFVDIIEKYRQLRPKNMYSDRFFLHYLKGKCVRSVIGMNKIVGMPKQVATYLNLPDAHLYTSRCFRGG